MKKVLIACNNDADSSLHNFMQSCADGVRQICVDCGHTYTLIVPPHLTESEVIQPMENHQICFITAHGDDDGIYNELREDIVTIRTTNYAFSNKCFYSVSCQCAQNLCDELMRLGLKIFVGYNKEFIVGEDEDAFCDCALEGMRHILNGRNKTTAHKAMLGKYDELINTTVSFWDRAKLLRNKENLVFMGNEDVSLADLT